MSPAAAPAATGRRRSRRAPPWRALGLLAGGLGAFALAGLLGSAALFAVGSAALAAVVGGALVVGLGVRRIRVARRIATTELREGESLRIVIEVLRSPGAAVDLELLDGGGRWVGVPAAGRAVDVAIERRGTFAVAPSLLRIRDPLGIVAWRIAVGEPQPVTVLPLPTAVGERHAAARAAGRDVEPDGLRPYVPGTPIARVHWRSLARGDELHERRLGAAPSDLPLVVVDTAGAPDEAVDWVARATAGHLERFARDGGCRLLLPGDPGPQRIGSGTAAVRAALRRLAALERSPTVVRPEPGDGDAIWLRASRPPAGAPLRPRSALPPGVTPIRIER